MHVFSSPPTTPQEFEAAMTAEADKAEVYVAASPMVAPTSPAMPTDASRRLDELHDSLARAADDLECLQAHGTRGGDVLRPGEVDDATASPPPADPLAEMRDPPPPIFRRGRRRMGTDFARFERHHLPADKLRPSRPPKGSASPRPDDMYSVAERRRWHLPSGDWRQIATDPADGVEFCEHCRRRVTAGRKVARLIHDANDAVLRVCLPCAAGLQDRPLAADEHPEARRLSGYNDAVSLSQLADARLWQFNVAATFGVLHLAGEIEVAVLRVEDGFELTIQFPDYRGLFEHIGTYATCAEAQLRALDAIRAWEARG